MCLPVIFCIAAVITLMLSMSLRISVEVTAGDSGINYTIRGSILRYIKILEIKSGTEKKRKPKKKSEKKRDRILGIVKAAFKKKNGKMIHVEKLSLTGTFSTEDAAADAILHGLFIILWQFIIIFLSANFTFEHQNYNFLPDFQNNRNELVFQLILRIVILNALIVLIRYYLSSVLGNNTE